MILLNEMVESASFHEEEAENMMVFPDEKLTSRNMGRAVPPDPASPLKKESIRSFQQVLFPDAGTRKGVGKHDQFTEEDKHP